MQCALLACLVGSVLFPFRSENQRAQRRVSRFAGIQLEQDSAESGTSFSRSPRKTDENRTCTYRLDGYTVNASICWSCAAVNRQKGNCTQRGRQTMTEDLSMWKGNIKPASTWSPPNSRSISEISRWILWPRHIPHHTSTTLNLCSLLDPLIL